MPEARVGTAATPATSATTTPTPTTSWDISRGLFVRGIGLTYLCAFVSLGVQLPGLVGSDGILPAAEFLERVREVPGASAFWPAPTLAWFDASDGALRVLWTAGAAASLAAIAGIVPAVALAASFVLYLSLVSIGQTFLGFQWDALLLEAGFLSIFCAPWTLRLSGPRVPPASPISRVLCGWLVFRLFFFSGLVKLASGDATWWDGTALAYHWWTQPLPTTPAWWAAQLPPFASRIGVVATLVIEIALPFALAFGRWPRLVAAAGFVGLQALIVLTGNYGFFNLLAVVLCLPLIDDRDWCRVLRRPLPNSTRPIPRRQRVAIAAAAVLVAALSVPVALGQAGLVDRLPAPLAVLVDAAAPARIVNTYGLFARMTTSRVEIVIEGSRDGSVWTPYVFRWKPGPLDRAPAFLGPHMPRLDWQMWFAALARPERSPWLFGLLRQLLRGSEPVRALLATDPFPDEVPLAVRARVARYRFSTREERARSGAWWTRGDFEDFIPEMRLSTRGGELRP